jgi:SAM-dependent methyltransferase
MPPARILEIGCAHGGFVALLRCAGFDAVGLELSPWVVNYARETFQVPVFTGPLEDQRLGESSLDIVVLMDVLEHLPDPTGTMREAMRALKPDGLIVIQTPEVPEGIDYEGLLARDHPFRAQLKPAEHLFLFSRRSIQLLCDRLGLSNLRFEVPIFAHYDMYLVASREPLRECEPDATVAALSGTLNGRLALALLDARKVIEKLNSEYGHSESDREARLAVIREQGQRIDWLDGQRNLVESEAAELRRNLLESKSAIAERHRIIDGQEANLARLAGELEEARARYEAVGAKHAESLDTVERQRRQVTELEPRLAAQTKRSAELEGLLAAAEVDRSARLSVIYDQGRRLGELDGERNTLSCELATVTKLLRASETDRADRLDVIEAQGRQLAELARERDVLGRERAAIAESLRASEADCATRLEIIEAERRQLRELEVEQLRQVQQLSATENRLSALRDQHSSQTEQLQRLITRNSYLENHWLTRAGIQLRLLRNRPR